MLIRIIYTVVIAISFFLTADAQIFSKSSQDYIPEIDSTPKFWEDPAGIVYQEDDLERFNSIGLWSYYKHSQEDGSKITISERYVYCLENLDQRSLQSEERNSILYPNPVSSILHIIHTMPMEEIEVRNLNGQLIKSFNCHNKNKSSIDVSSYHQGAYLLSIISNHEVTSKIFVVN